MTLEPDHGRRHAHLAFGGTVGAFMAVALVAGGSSTSPVSALIVRLVALPIGAWSIWRLGARGIPSAGRLPVLLMAAVVLLCLLQLTPLPAWVWTALPGRASVAGVYRLTGMTAPWRPTSLAPAAGWDAGLSLTVPISMFLATLSLGQGARRGIAAVVVIAALASLTLGILQLAGGQTSPLRFYQVTNPDSAVGFFANRNHQAMLLVAAIPFAGQAAARFLGSRGTERLFWVALAGAGALVLCVGLAATRSRAGVILALPAALGEAAILALCAPTGRGGSAQRLVPALAMVGALVIGGGLVAALSLSPLAARFEQPVKDELRLEVAPSLLALAQRYGPIGSGVGSFQTVYGSVERPQSMLQAYLNHAHDDYLEIWIECGWAGLGLIAVFALWWVVRTVQLVRYPAAPGASLGLTGALVVALFLAHSAVDYPLRTGGLDALFAFACGLMVLA